MGVLGTGDGAEAGVEGGVVVGEVEGRGVRGVGQVGVRDSVETEEEVEELSAVAMGVGWGERGGTGEPGGVKVPGGAGRLGGLGYGGYGLCHVV